MMIRASAVTFSVLASGCYASMHHQPVAVRGHAVGYYAAAAPEPWVVEPVQPVLVEPYGYYGEAGTNVYVTVETGWCDYGGHTHWHDGHGRHGHHRHWGGDAHARGGHAAPRRPSPPHDSGDAFASREPSPPAHVGVPNRPWRLSPPPGEAPTPLRPEPRDRGSDRVRPERRDGRAGFPPEAGHSGPNRFRPEPGRPAHPAAPEARDPRPRLAPPAKQPEPRAERSRPHGHTERGTTRSENRPVRRHARTPRPQPGHVARPPGSPSIR